MAFKILTLVSLITCFQVMAGPITNLEMAQQIPYQIPKNDLAQDHAYLTPAFHYLLDEKTKSRMSAGNELILLPDGKSFQKKLEMVKTAKSSIWLSVMAFECGESGKEMTQALISAKKRGVDVRIILDKLHAKVIPIFKKCHKVLKKNGVKLSFSPHSTRLRSLFRMMHDKILVKDLKEGIIGGQNMMDINNLATPTNFSYRDTDVWVKGPVLLDLALRNIENWKSFSKSKNVDPIIQEYVEQIKEKEKEYEKEGLLGEHNYGRWLESSKGLCRMVGQKPISKDYSLTTLYTLLAKYSEDKIVIETPQLMKVKFELAEEMEREIKLAASRGVEVNFITNGENLVDSYIDLFKFAQRSMFYNGGLKRFMAWMAPKAGKRTGKKFLQDTVEWVEDSPVNIWKYRKFIHSKMSSFDGILNIVGSYNFDRHSATHNFESLILCIDDNFGKQVKDQLTLDFANSTLHK